MKMDDIQTIVICALFSVFGVALSYQWFTFPRNQGKYSSARKWLTILAAGVIPPVAWPVMNKLLGFLPEGWDRWVMLAVFGLFCLFVRPSANIAPEEKDSSRRMQLGVLISGAILIAIGMIIFLLKRQTLFGIR
jgi:hypothetical protein